METHSLPKEERRSRYILEGQLRACYGRVVYSHKIQEKCAEILNKRLTCIKWFQIVLSTLATSSFVSTVFGLDLQGSVVGASLSAILLALNLYTKEENLGELVQKHKQTAADTWHIREKYQSLIADLISGLKPLNLVTNDRDSLAKALHSIYKGSPSTNSKAYRKAQAGLKSGEEMTFTDEEIDSFLPVELKREGG